MRTFPAPRRVHMLLMRPSGRSFYAVGFNLDEFDVKTGKLLGTRGIQQWNLPEHGQPDLLAFWPVTEPTGVWTSPVYADLKKGAETVPTTALMSLDLKSGELAYRGLRAAVGADLLHRPEPRPQARLRRLHHADEHRRAGAPPGRSACRSITRSTTINLVDGRPRDLHRRHRCATSGFYDAATLEKKAMVKLPGCPDQSIATLRVIPREITSAAGARGALLWPHLRPQRAALVPGAPARPADRALCRRRSRCSRAW